MKGCELVLRKEVVSVEHNKNTKHSINVSNQEERTAAITDQKEESTRMCIYVDGTTSLAAK